MATKKAEAPAVPTVGQVPLGQRFTVTCGGATRTYADYAEAQAALRNCGGSMTTEVTYG